MSGPRIYGICPISFGVYHIVYWRGAATWVLPNPSGLQAHYQLPELVKLFPEDALHRQTQQTVVADQRQGGNDLAFALGDVEGRVGRGDQLVLVAIHR